jgi:UDP-N-acetyl-2-amino-2-deoxyglucuronate dehydrogenase
LRNSGGAYPGLPRIAIVGAGLAATPHAKALNELSDVVQVACVVGRSKERLDAFCQAHGFACAGSLDDVLYDDSIDAILVLTPPNTHLDIVENAAAARNHVLLEKPLEASFARAERLVAICARSGICLGVVFQNRFRESVQRLAAIVQAGVLGKLAYAGVDLRWWRPQDYYAEPGRGTYSRDGGGVLMTQAIHIIDLMLWLAGDVAEVTAKALTTSLHTMEAEDFVSAGLKFKSGAAGHIFATTAAFPGFPERLEFVGGKATAVLTGGHLQVFHRDGRTEEFRENASTGFGAKPMAFSHAAHRALLLDFVIAIREGRKPAIGGVDALRAQRLIERMSNRP